METFWLVFKNHEIKKFEILGLTANDTELTENTARMVNAGQPVNCETAPSKYSEEEVCQKIAELGYTYEVDLYDKHLLLLSQESK